jgi:hypothetical protein
MAFKKLASLAAVTVAVASGAAPAAMAETRPGTVAPAPTSTRVIECHHLWGSTWICQARWSGGSAEYVCDSDLKLCIKQ